MLIKNIFLEIIITGFILITALHICLLFLNCITTSRQGAKS
jgi:hypothetical protein